MVTRPRQKRETPPICPVCGEDVPLRALACPECDADHNSGWREDTGSYDGVDLPDEFDYEEFTKREFGGTTRPTRIRAVWWITAIVLLVLTLIYFLLT